ncbi:putative tetratricopeptide-like helical domain superfamily [Dioscorea sansibarensis]
MNVLHGVHKSFLPSTLLHLPQNRTLFTTSARHLPTIQNLTNFLTSLHPHCHSIHSLKRLHSLLIVAGFIQSTFFLRETILKYVSFGVPELVLSLYRTTTAPSLLLLNYTVRGLSDHGFYDHVLNLYAWSQTCSFQSDNYTFPFVIKSCAALGSQKLGKEVHCVVLKTGYDGHSVVQTSLLDMYAKTGSMEYAEEVFDQMSQRDLVSWNALVCGYLTNGYCQEAFEAFREMLAGGLMPSASTLVSVIPVCMQVGEFSSGRSLHGFAIKCGVLDDEVMTPTLISMYGCFNDLYSARKLFEMMLEKHLVAWNAMISAYAKVGESGEACGVFQLMHRIDMKPNLVTLVSVLPSCCNLPNACYGESVHAIGIKFGLTFNVGVVSALVSMYAKLGELDAARYLFNSVSEKSLLLWNSMISGYLLDGLWHRSLDIFIDMVASGVMPDAISMISVISACSISQDLRSGLAKIGDAEGCMAFFRQMGQEGMKFDLITLISVISGFNQVDEKAKGMPVHALVIKSGYSSDTQLTNALIRYRDRNLFEEVMVLFDQMKMGGQKPNSVTLLNLLPICVFQQQGKSIHAFAFRNFSVMDSSLLTSTMCMYARFENLDYCSLLFELLDKRNIISWNTKMSVYLQSRRVANSLTCFKELLTLGMQPDSVTILTLVSACSAIGSLELAQCITSFIICKGFDKNISVSNALIDLFAKCGSIAIAKDLFNISHKDTITWSVIINAFGIHGDGPAALDLFSKMQEAGLKPDDVTIVSILSACSHSGLVEEARVIFKSMIEENWIQPRMEHYACMVDLLGRTGYLDEAYDLIRRLPFKPCSSLLESLLGACRSHGNVEIGEAIGKLLVELKNCSSNSYVMLSNIYAVDGRWNDSGTVRYDMEMKGLRKEPGVALIVDS